ncbi:DoxX family protein [Actinophytocola oryzae]|uniref:DoxX-like protein n=1 Tax=Actinophytocola oryzae TaxID=502181 RepID=A0A4R7VAP2_9PSEU|nr:DoxX family protein [Actinophytocola oryzae]TDV46050.1 DoxX-like protein [Actinophytocola oryzae]
MASRSVASRPYASRPIAVAVDVLMWTTQAILAAYFVYSASLLFGDELVGKFAEIGVGQWLRYVTGVLELAGAIGLVVPFLCGLAGLGLAGVMAGAVGTELFLLAEGDALLPAVLGGLAVVVAIARWGSVRTALTRVGLRHADEPH